ncbi:MAG: nucleoside monophosphate kinase [Proteobacteria bacterium]|nr:nucleoside monophosphate kinase [Pseudomonadota bacterium]
MPVRLQKQRRDRRELLVGLFFDGRCESQVAACRFQILLERLTLGGIVCSGKLVPDELLGDMISERLARQDAQGGFILDGFTRTTEQVAIRERVLEQRGVSLGRGVLLVASDQELVRPMIEEAAAAYEKENNITPRA